LASTIARDIKRVDHQKFAGCGTRIIPSATRGSEGPDPSDLQIFMNNRLARGSWDPIGILSCFMCS